MAAASSDIEMSTMSTHKEADSEIGLLPNRNNTSQWAVRHANKLAICFGVAVVVLMVIGVATVYNTTMTTIITTTHREVHQQRQQIVGISSAMSEHGWNVNPVVVAFNNSESHGNSNHTYSDSNDQGSGDDNNNHGCDDGHCCDGGDCSGPSPYLPMVANFGHVHQQDVRLRLLIQGPAGFYAGLETDQDTTVQIDNNAFKHLLMKNHPTGKQIVYAFFTQTIDCGPSIQGTSQSGRQPPQFGFDVWDQTDPENPVWVKFMGSPLNNTFISTFAIINDANSTYFAGDLLAISFATCRGNLLLNAGLNVFGPTPIQGILLYNVTDPMNPNLISITPFGDTVPYALPAGNPSCQPGNVNHQYNALFGWSAFGEIYLWGNDPCETAITATAPQEDIFRISNPFAPVLIQEITHVGSTGLNYRVPVLPLPYDQNGIRTFMQNAQFYWNGTSPFVLTYAADNGWITLNLTNPLAWVIVSESVWPTNDWFFRDERPVGNANCVKRSFDGRFAVAVHDNTAGSLLTPAGVSVMNAASAVTGTAGAVNPAGVTTKLNSTLVEASGGQRPLSQAGNAWCGPTVYLGYACNNSAPFVKRADLPLLAAIGGEDYIAVVSQGPRNDSNALEANCFFVDKVYNAVQAGYTAVLIVNDHTGATTPTLDVTRAVSADLTPYGFDHAYFPNTFVIGTGLNVLYSAFNMNLSTQLPYPLANSSAYTEPLVNSTGNRVCMNASIGKTDYGYLHLLNATTLSQRAFYTPIENRFIFYSGDVPFRGPQNCPVMHRSANVAAQMYFGTDIRVLQFGGKSTGFDTNSYTFGIQEIARIRHIDSDGGQPPQSNILFLYGPKNETYLSFLDLRGNGYNYRLCDRFLTPTAA